MASFYFPRKHCGVRTKQYSCAWPGKRKQDIAASDDQIDTAIRESGYKQWKVYAKAPFGGPDQVLKYLGRYTHKTAITSYRIEAVENGTVRFSYKDYADGNKIKSMVLKEQEFLQRFERHNLSRKSGFFPNALCASGIMGS
ncbi:transposase [Marivirga sp.]|uniref:transposase n=1 Tax=Marivirga sp. TaxID=2018662 RepID=UPI00345DA431